MDKNKLSVPVVESRIFGRKELEIIQARLNGDKSDHRIGNFYTRVRPKILEILDVWLPMRKDLEKLAGPGRKREK